MTGPSSGDGRVMPDWTAASVAGEANTWEELADERGFSRVIRLSRYRASQTTWPVFHASGYGAGIFRRRA